MTADGRRSGEQERREDPMSHPDSGGSYTALTSSRSFNVLVRSPSRCVPSDFRQLPDGDGDSTHVVGARACNVRSDYG